MQHQTEHRRGPDRRRQPRGGRRAEDRDGFAPLVLLVGEKQPMGEGAEAILARLKFAVSTAQTADEALRIAPQLRPQLIVVDPAHETLIRGSVHVPVVVLRDDLRQSPDALVDEVRRALRVTPIR